MRKKIRKREMVIMSIVGIACVYLEGFWEIIKSVPSYLVKTLAVFSLIGLLVSCGGGGGSNSNGDQDGNDATSSFNYNGQWEGSSGADSFLMDININETSTGYNITFNCVSDLVYVSHSDSELVMLLELVSGVCSPSRGTAVFTPINDNFVEFELYTAGVDHENGNPVGSALLERK